MTGTFCKLHKAGMQMESLIGHSRAEAAKQAITEVSGGVPSERKVFDAQMASLQTHKWSCMVC